MKKIIKHFAILTILSLLSGSAFSQEKNNSTFQVVSTSKVTNTESYIKAMEMANFNCYHLKKTRRKLTFDTGVEIELFSIAEISAKGLKFDASCAVDENKLEKKAPVYHLSESGIIMEMHDDDATHQKH
jgi:hypothetical protein